MTPIIVDTGPLVAFLNRRDAYHRWTKAVLDTVTPPLFTCDAVLTEACHLVGGLERGSDTVLELVDRRLVVSEFRLSAELRFVRRLVSKFADVPMSLADACVVRMSELRPAARVLTLDGDFRMYRRNRTQAVPVLMPD